MSEIEKLKKEVEKFNEKAKKLETNGLIAILSYNETTNKPYIKYTTADIEIFKMKKELFEGLYKTDPLIAAYIFKSLF